MGEDALRGGFTGGFWVTGEVVPKLYYTVMLGNNLSTLGVTAVAKNIRNLSKSVSLLVDANHGEFGPRGGIGDNEGHQTLATRFRSIFHAIAAKTVSITSASLRRTTHK